MRVGAFGPVIPHGPAGGGWLHEIKQTASG